MSHKRYARLHVVSLNRQLAEAALKALAQLHGGTLDETGLGIRWGQYAYYSIARGLQGLQWEYDDYSAPVKFREFQRLFAREYSAAAIQAALRAMGRQVQVARRGERVHIQGVAM